MLVQFYFPYSISPSRYDKYLAGGWFRSGNRLFRSRLICFEGDLYSLVNIRLGLKDYSFSKSRRKLLSKNGKQFTYSLAKASITPEKEKMYQAHKNRFKGFYFDTLKQFFMGDLEARIFNTWEISVYDGDKLVAVSFFDEAEKSVASLLGIFDPDYAKASLGMYTMLLEIKWAQERDKKYYYPGFVFDKPSIFDYKLSLGKMQFYNWKGRWQKTDNFDSGELPAEVVKSKMDALGQELQNRQLPHKRLFYPYFSLGYVQPFGGYFLKGPEIFVFTDWKEKRSVIVAEYQLEEDEYYLCQAVRLDEMDDIGRLQISDEYRSSENYCFDLLTYQKLIYRGKDAAELASKIQQSLG